MRISVIITTYNRAAFLKEAIESVLAQTRMPDEVIVVDDGSEEETRTVVESLGQPIRYRYQSNSGKSAARDHGLECSTGDALLFLDDDDRLLPKALAMLEQALLQRPKASLAYCRAQLIDSAGNVTKPLWQAGNEAERDGLWEALASVNFIRSVGCVLVRRAEIVAIGRWDSPGYLEDWDMWLRLAEKPDAEFARVLEPLFQYRIHDANVSHQTAKMYEAGRRLYQMHRDRYPEGNVRRRILEGLLAENPPLTGERKPETPRPTLRHRILRGLLEGSGIAPLYRRIPVSARMRIRSAFGIAPWTRG